jgi:3-oxoadipate enol-lactonase/3-oxoadipate enol-lactonase/4-carboxymuconolactone decarboxylase
VFAVANDPVLLLHGQPGAAADWERLRAAMGDRVRTIAVDRPGWDGRSPVTDLSGNARAALSALDAAGAARATVVGHSLGAAVAAWLAGLAPERVARLVLVAPAANLDALGPVDYLLAAPLVGWLASVGAMAGGGLVLGVRPVRRWVAETTALDDRYLRAAGRMLLAPAAWRAFVREQRFLVRDLPALECRLARISAPTTIVAGTGDHVVPIAAARRLTRQIAAAELVEVPRAGHLLHVQQAGRLAEAILSRP